MKLFVYAFALLSIVGAFQPPNPSRDGRVPLSMYRPDLNWDPAKDSIDEPLSNLVPDCTKPPTVSVLNRGTYEALNDHRTPEYRMPTTSPLPPNRAPPRAMAASMPPPSPPARLPLQQGDYFLPDPANNPSNPLAKNSSPNTGLVGTDRARDQRPEEWRRL